jgi:N-formylglutamate deformylase
MFHRVVRADEPGPIVVEVPHAGLEIDEVSARFTALPPDATDALLADADVGADVVWEGTEQAGVTRVVALIHRYVIDLNTDPRPKPAPPFYEKDPPPRPSIRRSAAGMSWRQDAIPRDETERRIRDIFEPYHAFIDDELERSRRLHGRALLLASHTFHRTTEPDVVIGSLEGRAAPRELRDAVADVFRAAGLSVACERPFPGGFSLLRHAALDEGIAVLQIEIARGLLTSEPAHRTTSEDAVARFRAVMAEVARQAPEICRAWP